MHIDGVNSEKFAQDYLINQFGFHKKFIQIIHKPYDLKLIYRWTEGTFGDGLNTHFTYIHKKEFYVEVKSTNLFQHNNKGKYNLGRFECWNKSQLLKMKKDNVWVMFVVKHDNGFFCQGFTKARNIPDKRKFSILDIHKTKLKTIKQFKSYIRQKNLIRPVG